MPIRAVLFDLGDTLWAYTGNESERLLRYYERARAGFSGGTAVPPAARLLEAVATALTAEREKWVAARQGGPQRPTSTIVAEGFAALGFLPPAGEVEAFTEAVFEAEAEMAANQAPEPRMSRSLGTLRQRGLRLAVVSNTVLRAETLWRILEARSLAGYVEQVVSSADVGFRKPHRECFAPALLRLGVTPREAVFVGDRLDTDIEGAQELGMTAVLTHQYRQEQPGPGTPRPDHIIAHLSELPALVAGLLSDSARRTP